MAVLARLVGKLHRLAHGNRVTQLGRTSATQQTLGKKKKMEDLEENPFMAKYADKIKELQRSDPEAFKSRLDARKLQKEKKTDVTPDEKPQTENLSLSNKPQAQLGKGPSQRVKKGLDSIVKLDLMSALPTDGIGRLWREYHKDKDRICAIIPREGYEMIQEVSGSYPMFLYALPKSTGYEFFFGQFEGDCCYFTSLVNYQAHRENAPIFLTLTHYTELQDEKGIVLLNGEINTDFLTVQEAQLLANQVQLYYATNDKERRGLLKMFNTRPDEFKHMDIIRLLQSQSVDTSDEGTPID